MSHTPRTHGGPDALGPARWDFSTNVNAARPCPQAVQALARTDATRYPDPGYHALRHRLAPGSVAIPALAYGDYAVAAHAYGRRIVGIDDATATLRWYAEPSSPLGQDAAPPHDLAARPTVLDARVGPKAGGACGAAHRPAGIGRQVPFSSIF